MATAARLFGAALNPEHHVYALNQNYVLWLIFDTTGDLFEVDVGPKSYYQTEFPNATKPSNQEFLSEEEYEEALQRISALKNIGDLQGQHQPTVPSAFGPLNTDRYERAFVDRIVAENDVEGVRKFDVYFLQDISGAPEQVLLAEDQSMVCMVGVWYYLPSHETRSIQLGKWQRLQVAGPNLRGTSGCVRKTLIHDADGFTIEQPQNATIVVSEPYRVRQLAGHVRLYDTPLEGAAFEVRRFGTKAVLRGKTNASGFFSIRNVPEGKYAFKVTKDGFKALSGTIFVDHNATVERLALALDLGT